MISKISDSNGEVYELWDSVYGHIKEFHPEITIKIIEEVLSDPDYIIKSSWDPNSYIYYKFFEKYFKVIVIERKEMRIKTALTTEKIKKEILYGKERNEDVL